MLIGLTGGIGSGKSTVVSIFSELGWHALDADSICHDLYKDADCEAYALMLDRWGREILTDDGAVDRKKIAGLVFENESEREWLNSILHPRVLDRAVSIYAGLDAKIPVIFDVPLLFEVKWERYFTKNIAVFASKEIQLKRLLERGMSVAEINSRIASQMTMEEKLEKADFGLINNGSLESLREQCKTLEKRIFDSLSLK